MQTREFVRAFGVVGACAATVLAIAVLVGPLAHAAKDKDDDNDESKIRQGFESAPVPLNLAHKNRALVGLGSYIVNIQVECDGCHSAGTCDAVPGWRKSVYGPAGADQPCNLSRRWA